MNEKLWEAARLNRAGEAMELLSFEVYGELAAQVNAKGLNDWTALHVAANEGSVDVVRALVNSAEETDLEAVTGLYQTPLHLAAAKGFLDIIQILVAAGARVNTQDYTGCTALHILTKNNHIETGAWLLSKDPDVTVKNEAGKTAYEESRTADMAEVFEAYFREKKVGFEKVRVEQTEDNTAQVDRSVGEGKREGRPRALKAFINLLKKPISALIEETTRRKTSDSTDQSINAETVTPSDFDIKGKIGSGAFGEVYLVVKRDTGAIYAMKVQDKKTVRKEELMKYVTAERNVLSCISHPFIVGLHFAFQTPQKLILVLDYCPGGDLGGVITRERRLSEEVARMYLCEVILAIEELHSRNVLYRDLKPENVLLDYQGHAILTDFGLSKENVPDDEVAESFLGSQMYLAPEVLTQTGHHKSVDWYTLGTLFYEMLTGTPPYYAPKASDLYKNIKSAKLKIPPYVSPVAGDLLRALLNRNPSERLGSGPRGVLEIKSHPFFEGVDWAAVLRRQLRPPVPARGLKKHDELIDPEVVFGDLEAYDEEEGFEGWGFTSQQRG